MYTIHRKSTTATVHSWENTAAGSCKPRARISQRELIPPCTTRRPHANRDSPVLCTTVRQAKRKILQCQYKQSLHRKAGSRGLAQCLLHSPYIPNVFGFLTDISLLVQITRCPHRRNVFRAAGEKSRPLDGIRSIFERAASFVDRFQYGSGSPPTRLRAL